MTKRTRLFLLGAGTVLVAGLGTGLLASYMGIQGFGVLTGADAIEELDYIPADARLVAYANVRDVMGSELRRKIREVHPSGGGYERFKAETGIDVETDIDHIVVLAAGGDASPPQGPPVVLARGRFDEARVEAFLVGQGAAAEEYQGTRVLVNEAHRLGVAFLEPGLAAAGDPDDLRLVIDTKSGRQNVRSNALLMEHIREASDGNAWAVARFDALVGGRLPSEVTSKLPPITWFSASGYINGGVRGVLRADTRDAESAENLRDVIRGFVALARMQAGQQPQLVEIINSIELGGQGATVTLGFALPTDLIDALAARQGGSRSGPAAPPAGPEVPGRVPRSDRPAL